MPVLLALAAVLLVPAVVSVYAQEAPPEAPAEEQIETPEEEPEEEVPLVPEEEPEEEAPEAPATPEEQEVIEEPEEENTEEDEDPLVVSQAIVQGLQDYIDFAMQQHPGVAITSTEYVWKHGVQTAKFTFDDGWVAYISIGDGSLVKLADHNNKVRKCQKRVLSHRKFHRWYKKYSRYIDFWRDYQNNPEQTEEELEESDDQEAGAVQSAATDENNHRNKKSNRSKKHNSSRHSKKHWNYWGWNGR